VEDVGDLADLAGEFGKLIGNDGLDPIGESFLGLVVDFDEQAVGSHGDCGARERKNLVALAGAVARIDEDGQVAAFLDGGNDRKVQSVAGKNRRKCARRARKA
jgi:hypothetical protein